MTMQQRRGLLADFDPWKMKPGEWGITTDTTAGGRKVYMCFVPGEVKEIATLDQLNELVSDASVEITKELFDYFKAQLTQVTNKANEASDAAQDAAECLRENQLLIQSMQETLNDKIDGGYVDDENKLYLTSEGRVVAGPFGPFAGGAGGGGAAENNALLTVVKDPEFNPLIVAQGQSCKIAFNWSSIESDLPTGNGSMTLTVGGVAVNVMEVEQGRVELELSPYLQVGTNAIRVEVFDVYGNHRYLAYTIRLVAVYLDSNFDSSTIFDGIINYTFIPYGSVAKTVYFYVDGQLEGTVRNSTTGRQQTYVIPRQSHGAHTLEVYFTAEVEGKLIESNHMFYELICVEVGNPNPIIAIEFNRKEVTQYETLTIKYSVYSPDSMTSQIVLKEGDQVLNEITVDRTPQYWSYKVKEAGDHTLTIQCGDVSKSITFKANEVSVNVEAETQDLDLHLSAEGRSNGEANPAEWKYNDIECDFINFNFVNDGWQLDEDGITVCRVGGKGRLIIPLKPFEKDCRVTGKTIEFDIATRDVRDFDSVIISCFNNGRGFQFTGQQARLASEQSDISIQYKEGEHLRVSFVILKQSEARLILCFIEGHCCGATQYPADDDFSQLEPTVIEIGSDECTVDIYTVRVYNNGLSMKQIEDNWVADTADGEKMMERAMRNDVYDDFGRIAIDKLPTNLPYIIWSGDKLPEYKGNKLTVSGSYTDPIDRDKSFTYETSQIDVQGTSSAGYEVKNFKQKFTDGIVTNKGKVDTYPLRDGAIPTNTFTHKADVASSEGANNVELVRLYNDTIPVKHPAGEGYRWGIDGKPMVAFHQHDGTTSFVGKYNFNNDKGTPEVYGFSQGDESWEVLNNTSDRVLFKSDDFSGNDWLGDFEGRYPDGNTDKTRLEEMVKWVKSTEGNVDKFKNELEMYFSIDSSVFYWLFTEFFLMVDSRAKNAFPTYFASTGKWYWLPYDFDTALGINNEGQLVFGYELEDTDHLEGGVDVFNGQQSVFWNNLRDGFGKEIQAMYQKLRSDGAWTYDKVIKMFEEHQSVWPEAIINEDSQVKYIDPLLRDGNSSYLPMLQGTKRSQRERWLSNRFRYMDSKYNVGDDLTDAITIRGYEKADVYVTPCIDMYANVKYGSVLMSTRAKRNQTYKMECPLSNVNDTEIYIYSSSQLSSVGDLSGFKVGFADFSKAVKLSELKLGDGAETYSNPNLSEVSLGKNRLLRKIDLRNCVNFTQTLNVEQCENIETVLLEGTSVSGINLPDGGIIDTLHFPETLNNLTILNHKPRDLQVPNVPGLTTLRLENVGDSIDIRSMLDEVQPLTRVRLVGIHFECENTDDIKALFDQFDTFRGLDDSGQNTDKAQISGTIHVPYVLGKEIAELQERYRYVTITADHISSNVYYWNYDGTQLLHTEEVVDGADGVWSDQPSREMDERYTYAFAGWATSPNGKADSNAQKGITADRNLYAAYTPTERTFTATFMNGKTQVGQHTGIKWGGTAVFPGKTSELVDPEGSGQPFDKWDKPLTNITADTTFYAQYVPLVEVKEVDADEFINDLINETYAGKYKIGNYAVMTATDGSWEMKMQLATPEGEGLPLTDGSGNAVFDLIGIDLLPVKYKFNDTNGYTSYSGWQEISEGSYQAESERNVASMFEIIPDRNGEITISTQKSTSGCVLEVKRNGLQVIQQVIAEVGSKTAKISLEKGRRTEIIALLRVTTAGNRKGTLSFSDFYTQMRKEDFIEQSVYGANGSGGFGSSYLRGCLINNIWPKIPDKWKKVIAPIQLSYDTFASGELGSRTTGEYLWLPRVSDLTAGGKYTALFRNSTALIKNVEGTPSQWFTSTIGVNRVIPIDRLGNVGSGTSGTLGYGETANPPLCFSVRAGLQDTISDSWDEIIETARGG